LALNKIPNDFPQLRMGIRKYPLVFYSEGALTLFERELEYKGHKAFPSNGKYVNLKDDLHFDINYNSLEVSRYLHPNPFMKTFNILWIKLSVTHNNSIEHLLISAEGQSIKQISNTNDEIFQILENKATFVSIK